MGVLEVQCCASRNGFRAFKHVYLKVKNNVNASGFEAFGSMLYCYLMDHGFGTAKTNHVD